MAEMQRSLKDILLEQGLVGEKDLNEALEEQKNRGENLGQILLRDGFINAEDLCKCLAIQFNMEVVKPSNYQIDKEIIDKIPAALARRHRFLPLKMNNNTLTVAMADPLSFSALDNLRVMLDCEVEGVLAPEDEMTRALDRYYGTGEESIESMIQVSASGILPS